MESSLKTILRGMCALFALLILSVGFWSIGKAPGLAHHVRNPRQFLSIPNAPRGGIYTAEGESLTVTILTDDGFQRLSQAPRSLLHVVGYADQRFGLSGLEAYYNRQLAGDRADIITTIDLQLQEEADRLLAGKSGAIVAIDPNDGSIIAMASMPSFDVDALEKYFDSSYRGDGPLFNRATQGLYPPGSAFKPLIMAAALDSETVHPLQLFHDEGWIQIGPRRISNFSGVANGVISLDEALALSSNAVFAQLGSYMEPHFLSGFAAKLGFGFRPPLVLPVAAGFLPSVETLSSPGVRAEFGIGHGGLLVTPLQMALLAATFGTGGKMPAPRIVRSIKDVTGKENVLQHTPPVRVMSAGTAEVVKQAMMAVVTGGTGKKAAHSTIKVAGKTGSADQSGGKAHAWFIGFAPADNPKIALAIVIEQAGIGGEHAAPIARNLFSLYLTGTPDPGRTN